MGDKYIIKQGLSKYPSFHYKELDNLIKEKEFILDTTINSIKCLKKYFEQLTNELNEIIDSNTNNFNIQSRLYNRNTYNYLILSKLDLQLCELLLYKLSNINENTNYIFDKNITINEIKSKYKNKNEISSILKRIKFLLDKFEIIYTSNHTCAITYLNIAFNYIICYTKEILNQITIFKSMILSKNEDKYKYNMDNEIILIDLIFMLEKLDSICIFLSSGYFVNSNDIFNQIEGTGDWEDINKIAVEVIFKRENEIQKVFKQQSIDTEKIVSAILNSYNESNYKITNAYYFLSKFIKYGNNQKLMLYESGREQLIQDKNVSKEIMEIVLWPWFKKLGSKNYQKINFRRKIYVKKQYPDITLENIQKLLKLMGNKDIDVSNIKQEIIYHNKNDIINNKEITKEELYINKPTKNTKKYYVSITILNNSQIIFPEEKTSLKYSIMGSIFKYHKPKNTQEGLMIFIHGGGFVGMSTHFHESFLREWANLLKIPIIGINYALSPKHKYPYALNDCYQAYRWIIDHCEDVIGIKPKKIILAGDSSGGGLILSITYLIIAKNEFENENIRLPDLLLPMYPCCNTSANIMQTSFMLSMKDFLLNDKFLLYVNEAYRDIYPNDDDPFLNPAQAKECILKKLPKSVWQFGSCDPLRDDIIRLLGKLSKIKELDVKAYQLREYNHGYIGGNKIEFLVNVPTELLFKEIKDILNN